MFRMSNDSLISAILKFKKVLRIFRHTVGSFSVLHFLRSNDGGKCYLVNDSSRKESDDFVLLRLM